MPYTMEDFRRDYAKEILEELTAEERLAGLSLEERLKGLSVEQLEKYLNRRRKMSGSHPAKDKGGRKGHGGSKR